MKPKFTDTNKFPEGGYVPASKTNIAKTFARIRREQAAKQKRDAELSQKVRQIKRKES